MKSKFNLLYEQIMSTLVTESGNMVSDVVKIKRENITPTFTSTEKTVNVSFGVNS